MVNWDDVLPWEVDWDAVLPDHQWNPRGSKSWEDVMPPPRRQLDVLPEDFEGSCLLHSFAETLTSLLRKGLPLADLEVDLHRLLLLAVGKGVLIKEGATAEWVSHLARTYGIPLEGNVAGAGIGCGLDDLNPDGDLYALNTSIFCFSSSPMPQKKRNCTTEAALEAIKYRERLCDVLDHGPVMISLEIDDRYALKRQDNQPYCRPRESWLTFGDPPKTGHCVTAYGYKCPGGDVRTLRVLYQENATFNPKEEVPQRMVIHPDAIDYCQVIRLRGLEFSNTPSPGYQDVELHHPIRKPPSWWKKAIDFIF